MRPDDFDLLATMLKQRSGLVLSRDKVYLLESRLLPLARKKGWETLDELIREVRLKKPEPLIREIVEAMTTNESFFFRDTTPFDLFREHVLPAMEQTRAARKQMRIWCAAASTGQEPYSLAMLLREAGGKFANWKIDIVGTDICSQVLQRAQQGVYSQFEVQRGLPIKLLIKYFQQTGEMWQIDAALRAMVQYREFNLLDNYTPLGTFDVIYCRNVLIYFDQDTKARVLDNMAKILAPDGFLFLGAAETVLGITEKFKPVRGQRGMYVLNEQAAGKVAAIGGR